VVVYGFRGTGKTVLLSEIRERTEARNWVVLGFEATKSTRLEAEIAESVRQAAESSSISSNVKATLQRLAGRLSSVRLSVDESGNPTLGVDLTGGSRPQVHSPNLAESLIAAASAVRKSESTGIVLAIDELQKVDSVTMEAICLAVHQASQRDASLLFLGAGLPSLPGTLAETSSYAERLFNYVELGQFEREPLDDAVLGALATVGGGMDIAGLAMMAALSNGYPFLVQVYGSAAWAAASTNSLTAADVSAGAPIAERRLRGFFSARWDRATDIEQEYLRGLASQEDKPMTHEDICKARSLDPRLASKIRGRLIAKGLIFNMEGDRVAFTSPGFSKFIHTR
jgi:hypothetical protein